MTEVQESQANSLVVAGEISLDTVGAYLERGVAAIEATQDVLEVDLRNAVFTGSAGIALLIGWLRHARESGKKIIFRRYPENLPAIARSCGVLEILDLQSD